MGGVSNMATVYDVAKYILDKYGSMSAMKLQKLIFYSQAMSLVWDDIPLFEDDFEAWRKGPVCRELYNAHKGKFMLDDSTFLEPYLVSPSALTDDQKETIDAVVRSLIDVTPYQLSCMTHREAPWKDARGGIPDTKNSDAIISKESMMEYYAEHW
ncbi:DUF4065 domain-containing protein [Selenomonas sp. TAMA-11512]|nr:DUF4065 domain-containing protein [Selenomonas sp. TAMA-11512]